MPSLLDAIRKNSPSQPVGQTDETGKIATLLRAKSGKQVASPDVASSSLGEQQTNVQTNQSLGQIAGQGQVQQAGLQAQSTGQAAELAGQKAQIAQNNRFNTVQAKLETSKLLDEYARNKGTLDLAQDKAKVNQLGMNLRMQNQQYVDNLQREGARSRLNDQNQFKQELAKQTFGDNEALFRDQLGNKSILDASKNEFERAMGGMTAEQAYDAFHNNMATEKERAMYTGIGSIASAGIGAAASGSFSGKSTGASPEQISANENKQATSDVNLMKSRH